MYSPQQSNSGNAWLAILGLLNSGVAAFYYLRVLGQMYMVPASPADNREADKVHARPAFVLAMAILVLAVFVLGIFPGRFLDLGRAGASTFTTQPNLASQGSPPKCRRHSAFSREFARIGASIQCGKRRYADIGFVSGIQTQTAPVAGGCSREA